MYYSYEKIHDNYFLIRKEYIEAGKRINLGYYLLVGNIIFNAPDFKDVLKSKLENIANILHEMQSELINP